jgi:hypothetical protein
MKIRLPTEAKPCTNLTSNIDSITPPNQSTAFFGVLSNEDAVCVCESLMMVYANNELSANIQTNRLGMHVSE